MSKRFSLYLPDQLVEWIDNKAKKENRSRNNYIEKILRDLEQGRLVPLRSDGEDRSIDRFAHKADEFARSVIIKE